MPLITIVAGRADLAPNGASQEEWTALVSEKMSQKRAFAKLSHNSEVVVDANAGHRVQLDDPDVVVKAIQDVQTACSKHTHLSQ